MDAVVITSLFIRFCFMRDIGHQAPAFTGKNPGICAMNKGKNSPEKFLRAIFTKLKTKLIIEKQ
jgi:hypothetical protein